MLCKDPTKAKEYNTAYRAAKPRAPSVLHRYELYPVIHDLLELPGNPKGNPKSKQIVNTVLDTIAAALKRGEDVHIRGFGVFRVRSRMAHGADLFVWHEPGKGTKALRIRTLRAAHKFIRFSPATSWTAEINIARGFPLSFYERRTVSYWK